MSKKAWSLERAEPVCKSVAKWALRLFYRQRAGWDYKDLVSEAILISLREHKNYRPRAAHPYETWLRVRLRDRLRDRLRSVLADARRTEAYAETRTELFIDIDLIKAKAGLTRRTGRCCRRRFSAQERP